jgi:hypothetical protein
MELKRMMAWKPLLEECQDGDLPFMCLQYKDKDSVQHVIPAVFVGKLASFSSPSIMDMVSIKALLEYIYRVGLWCYVYK